ncbi:hypothetical protein RI054_44g152860 [Pseudoscourfieldia marina]
MVSRARVDDGIGEECHGIRPRHTPFMRVILSASERILAEHLVMKRVNSVLVHVKMIMRMTTEEFQRGIKQRIQKCENAQRQCSALFDNKTAQFRSIPDNIMLSRNRLDGMPVTRDILKLPGNFLKKHNAYVMKRDVGNQRFFASLDSSSLAFRVFFPTLVQSTMEG